MGEWSFPEVSAVEMPAVMRNCELQHMWHPDCASLKIGGESDQADWLHLS